MLLKRNNIGLWVVLGLVCFFCMPSNTQADEKKSYAVIATSIVKEMWDSKANVVLIDTRNPEEYEDVHIPGAINIPQNKFNQQIDLLPKEKNVRLVLYCNGIK